LAIAFFLDLPKKKRKSGSDLAFNCNYQFTVTSRDRQENK
jgi:hypothetical protein